MIIVKGSEKVIFKKRNPIIFIHGILGSMGEDILEGSGSLNFGISEIVYRPIIDILKGFGYREGKDLFICYYDWTKKNEESVKNYLIPIIEKAKRVSKMKKVDLICHSMGGIVARIYAQSKYYNDDIDKLVMIGTPNTGSAKAYFFWSGGIFISMEPYKNVLYGLIKTVFIWYVRFKYNKEIDMDFIRNKIPSVEELLPSHEYGNYLILEDSKEIDIEKMNIQNKLINKLNKDKSILEKRNIKIYNLVGRDVDTIAKIKVKPYESQIEKWEDGKPTEIKKTHMGDGTVTCHSAGILDGKNLYIDSNHTQMLADCQKELGLILRARKKIFIRKSECFSIVYVIISRNLRVEIIDKEKSCTASLDIHRTKIDENISMTIIKTVGESNIDIEMNSTQGEGTAIISKANMQKKILEEKIIYIQNDMKLKI